QGTNGECSAEGCQPSNHREGTVISQAFVAAALPVGSRFWRATAMHWISALLVGLFPGFAAAQICHGIMEPVWDNNLHDFKCGLPEWAGGGKGGGGGGGGGAAGGVPPVPTHPGERPPHRTTPSGNTPPPKEDYKAGCK